MYSYIKGTVVAIKDDSCVVDVQGIGYRILLAPHHATKLSTGTVFLYLSFVIREFSQALYGFLHESERDIFEKLLDISGVGPKLALSIIGHLSPQDLKEVLLQKDIATLCKVPGIGKKTAERLLLELKGSHLEFISSPATISVKQPPLLQDAISALINLGYSQSSAQKAVSKTFESYSDTPDLSDLITASLRNV